MSEERESPRAKEQGGRPLRLALVVSEHTVREYATLLERLLVGLADESIPVALVCPPSCDVQSLVFGAVEIVRHPAVDLPLTQRLSRPRLLERLRQFEPTVLHCHCESKASLTRWLSRQLAVPYLLTVNSLQRWRRRLSISPRRCARIVVPAKTVAESVARRYPRLVERIEQINIGAYVKQDCGCFATSSQLVSMVTAHRFDSGTDFENLFRAVKQLVIEGYEFVLAMVGEGRAERQLRQQLEALDLLEVVTIVPRLRPWRSALAAGDIYIRAVASSTFDPFLLEAMSVGSAVAACKGGVDDLIIPDRTAVLFNPGDELSIRAALQRLLDRPEFARQLAEGAQEHLRENYSVSKMVGDTVRAYSRAMQWHAKRKRSSTAPCISAGV
ncbi:MAG: glycosyltransferase family 4 protein [Phycisphaerales bacterium]|nr:MAG: glycosyltransferase family 4 protein [Phycisphaerales bacterium]